MAMFPQVPDCCAWEKEADNRNAAMTARMSFSRERDFMLFWCVIALVVYLI
jgi:hypothetical protein